MFERIGSMNKSQPPAGPRSLTQLKKAIHLFYHEEIDLPLRGREAPGSLHSLETCHRIAQWCIDKLGKVGINDSAADINLEYALTLIRGASIESEVDQELKDILVNLQDALERERNRFRVEFPAG
ncbi:MAG: hypothetical protein Q9170_004795 [Blastenia crenularia]